ncbi:unnamed protein product, partial [Brassica napus]
LKKSFSIQNFSFNSKSFNSTHPCLQGLLYLLVNGSWDLAK